MSSQERQFIGRAFLRFSKILQVMLCDISHESGKLRVVLAGPISSHGGDSAPKCAKNCMFLSVFCTCDPTMALLHFTIMSHVACMTLVSVGVEVKFLLTVLGLPGQKTGKWCFDEKWQWFCIFFVLFLKSSETLFQWLQSVLGVFARLYEAHPGV